MSTKRTRQTRNLIPQISAEFLAYLSDGLLGEAPAAKSVQLFRLEGDENELRKLWNQHREAILDHWIQDYPGSRPSLWWQQDAPEPARQRLGGVGTPAHEVLAYAPEFDKGIPCHWVSTFDELYYNGLARDIHGDLIPCKWKGGDFGGKAINPRNPPVYESQAAYLKRHGLFEPGEEKRLKPADFEPEVVLPEAENVVVN